jgi:hypothetical protein
MIDEENDRVIAELRNHAPGRQADIDSYEKMKAWRDGNIELSQHELFNKIFIEAFVYKVRQVNQLSSLRGF